MIPRSNRHKYVVKELPYDLSQLQLGNCTEAYDDKADRRVSAIVWWCIILLLTLCAGIATIKDIPLFSIGAGAALLLEILGLLHSIKQRHRSQRLYVFEQGLVLDRIDHSKNSILKRQVVNFAQVSYIISCKRRNYSSNSNDDMTDEHYTCTKRTVEVCDANRNTLLQISGKYKNEQDIDEMFTWIWFAAKAIERQWSAYRLPVFWQELQSTSRITIPISKSHTLVLANDGIVYDNKFISRDNLIIQWYGVDEIIAIRDSSEKRNVLQKVFNLKEIHLDVSTMQNGCLLVAALQQLYGIQLNRQ